MKPIKFEELTLNGKGIFWVIFLVAGAAFVILSLCDVFTFLHPKVEKGISTVVYLGSAYHNLRRFMYRNYVMWNKKGITFRINSFWGGNFSFDNIRNVIYAEDSCMVYTHSLREPKLIDLAGIDQESKDRFVSILEGRGR